MYTVLVCDDDKEIVEAISIYLESSGYGVLKAYNGKEALELMEEEVQLAVIDVMMPVMDGIRATKLIREKSSVPVILLTAKSEDADKILGLDVGADDYVTKPFSPLELMARVRSQIRRYTRLGSRPEQPEEDLIVNGGLVINDTSKQVFVDGDEVKLTPIEYDILLYLSRNPGRVFSSSNIYEAVWNDGAFGTENVIAVHIRHIREKIEIDPKEPRYLKVVWGQGYRIERQK